MIVYVSIGNSDDKLSQADWSSFVLDVDRAFESAVRYEGARVRYVADSTWSGYLVDEEDEDQTAGVPCVVLWPTN